MQNQFIRVSGEDLAVGGQKILLRGFGIGNWMNMEHFMTGLPGNDQQKRQLFAGVYGEEHVREFFQTYLDCFVTEADFKFLNELGVNVVRLAFSYRHFEADQYPGEYLEEGFKTIDRVLGLCEKYHIYAILDLHAVPGGQNPDFHADIDWGVSLFWEQACLRQRMIELWRFIANRYRDNPWVAAYDLVNEPVRVPNAKVFNDFYDQVIDGIRQVDNNHLIFLEGDNWAQDFSLLHDPQDSQTAYSIHFYPLFSLAGNVSPASVSRKDIEAGLLPMVDKVKNRFHRPLWCGETGARFRQTDIIPVSNVLRNTLDVLEENNISWTLWAYKDAQAMGLVYPKDDTPWMRLVKKVNWNMLQDRTDLHEIGNFFQNNLGYPEISGPLRFQILFRMQGILQTLHLEQKLKPVLQSIPWEEMQNYPASFDWDNCRYYKEIADLVKGYTGK